jgi:hypothetical protein
MKTATENLLIAFNVKKGETPTTRDGKPDNYFITGFLSEDEYKRALDEAWASDRNLIKTSEFLFDHVLLSDSTIMSTSDYLDAVHGYGSGKPSAAIKRIINNTIYDFDLKRAKSEVSWYGNH